MGIPQIILLSHLYSKHVCAIADQDCGKCIHCCIVKSGFEADAYTATGLLHMYVSCADMKSGLKVFDNIPIWNVVAWTCLIAGYVNNNQPYEALKVFKDMSHCGVEPNEITMVNALIPALVVETLILDNGCTSTFVRLKTGIGTDISLATALLDMYAKTGGLGSAQKIFSSLQKRDVVMWTSMINGLAMHGDGNEALGMFQTMHEDSSLVPDHITYIGVLFACSHVGLVEEAKKHFRLMTEMYSIVPGREHYGCMVDLLSRSGHFGEAERLMETMAIQPNISI
ncbi:putative pentatricopeptide repeat-containing protein [Glycine max]|nr:putative pentatricopeptide repeat-containing protein [Glycine max]